MVHLRPATPEDRQPSWEWANRSDIASWVNIPQVAGSSWQPVSYVDFCADWKAFYFDGSAPERGRAFIIEVRGTPVGMVAHNDIDPHGQRTEIDIWLRAERFCGKGHGPAAIELLLAQLRENHGIVEAWAQPSERNPRSVRAFEKAGFGRRGRPSDPVFREYGSPDHPDSVLLVRTLAGH